MAERGSRRLRLLGQGLALPHPHEEAQGCQRALGETFLQGGCPRGQTRTHTIPAPTQVEIEPGAAGRLPGGVARGPTLRLRVPRPQLVRREELRTTEEPRIFVLRLRS